MNEHSQIVKGNHLSRRTNLSDAQYSSSKKLPHPHQVEAINNAAEYYKSNISGKLIMPCGSGKTLTALWIAERLNSKRTIIVLPTLQLQSQALDTWMEDIHKDDYDHSIIIIGSDKEIGSYYNIKPTTDEISILRSLVNLENRPLIIITTYHSSNILVKIANQNNIEFDICIFDEAHHTAGIEKASFQSLIQTKGFKVNKRLFMTATPKVLQGKGSEGEIEVFSMDDESIYGKEFYRLTTREAIEKGIISDYKLVTMNSVNDDVMQKVINNSILKDLSNLSLNGESRMIAVAITMIKTIQNLSINKIIAFASTIDRTLKFQSILQILGPSMGLSLDVFQIDNNHNDKERKEILLRFLNSTCAVIVNARILGEGFDMPAVDAVCFIDERSSVTDIMQAAGRAWRRAPNKKYGYIILPLLTNQINNDDLVSFKRVISALATSDEIVYSFFKTRHKIGNENLKIIHEITDAESFNTHQIIEDIRPTVWANLKTFNKTDRTYASWKEASEFTYSLGQFGVVNSNEWRKYCKDHRQFNGAPPRAENIPTDLRKVYPEYSPNLFFVKGIRTLKSIASKSEAIAFIKPLSSFGIYNMERWLRYLKDPSQFPGAPLPRPDIPAKIRQYENYRSKDFFGEPENRWLSFQEASAFTMSLAKFGITSFHFWKKYCRDEAKFIGAPQKPSNIPIHLDDVYKDDYSDETFFSEGGINKAKSYLSAVEAAKFTKSMNVFGVVNYYQWAKYCNDRNSFPNAPEKPLNIPRNLKSFYKEEFRENLFFTLEKFNQYKYLKIEEAKKFTLSLGEYGINNEANWERYAKDHKLFPGAPPKPENIPFSLKQFYRDEFKVYEFFVDSKPKINWMPCEDAAAFTQSLGKFGITNSTLWIQYCKSPSDFHGAPPMPQNLGVYLWEHYGKAYSSEKFFTKGRLRFSGEPASMLEALDFIRSIRAYGIKNNNHWINFCRDPLLFPDAPEKPSNIPLDLRRAYKEKYSNELFFPLSKRITKKQFYVSVEDAQKFTMSLAQFGILNPSNWKSYCSEPSKFKGAPLKPINIPSRLKTVYGDQYVPELFFKDGKGKNEEGKITKYKATAEETAKFTLSLGAFGINNYKEWLRYNKDNTLFPGAPAKPENIPIVLVSAYKGKFKSNIFFTKGINRNINYFNVEQAKAFTMSLAEFGVVNSITWKKYCKDSKSFPGAPAVPMEIPKNLSQYYKNEYKNHLFFSKGKPENDIYVEWQEAARFTKSLNIFGINTQSQWLVYCENPEKFPGAPAKPKNIPKHLNNIYGGVIKYKANIFFSGSVEMFKQYATPDEAAKFTKSLSQYGITKQSHWIKYCEHPEAFPGAPMKPDNIPVYLYHHYKAVFTHEMFFVDGHRKKSPFVTMEEARIFTLSLGKFGIINRTRWLDYCYHPDKYKHLPKKPENIPVNPWDEYGDNFRPEEFFVNGKTSKITWATAEEASQFTLSLAKFGITNTMKWEQYFKKPSEFPGAPPCPKNIPRALREKYRGFYSPEKFFSKPNIRKKN